MVRNCCGVFKPRRKKMLPCDLLETVFCHLDFRSLSTARLVCSGWAEIGRQEVVVAAAAVNTRSKLTRPVIKRGLGLTDAEIALYEEGEKWFKDNFPENFIDKFVDDVKKKILNIFL